MAKSGAFRVMSLLSVGATVLLTKGAQGLEEKTTMDGNIKTKPHVLLVLSDDYGWANFGLHIDGLGPHGKQLKAEVNTPNLDRFAKEGVLLDRHYTFRICSPSRSSLMSGRLPVHVNMVNTGITDVNLDDPVSGSAGIPRNMTCMASKMKEGGYKTHMIGKWDAGAATPEHTPWGRGFDTFFGYFQHANDYWQKDIGFTSTGEVDVCLNKFVDFTLYNETYKGGVTDAISREMGCLMSTEHSPLAPVSLMPHINATGCVNASYCLADSCYEEAQLLKMALSIIQRHDPSTPMFMFYTSHLLHTPLQVPESYLRKLDRLVAEKGGGRIDSANRRLYAAMTLYLDDAVAELESALKARGMWDNTLMIFTSDNGGPLYEPGAANNYPHKGGKYTDWEGGIRTNAFVSGGYVPASRRGSTFSGVISIADWVGTLAELAGVSQEDVAAMQANEWLKQHGLPLLPPVDSVPQWKHIVGDTNGRPDSWHISDKAIMRYPFKLVVGQQLYSIWAGQLYPNCTTIKNLAQSGPVVPLLDDVKLFGENLPLPIPPERVHALMEIEDCGEGCLFNVATDPSERSDLAGNAEYADLLKELQADLREFNRNNFKPDRGSPTMNACWKAVEHGGFYGPFVSADGFYSPVHFTPAQEKQNTVIKHDLEYVEHVLLPNRTKQIDWFQKNIGDLTALIKGETFDTCLNPHLPSLRKVPGVDDAIASIIMF